VSATLHAWCDREIRSKQAAIHLTCRFSIAISGISDAEWAADFDIR
jgi:hypothetical protein